MSGKAISTGGDMKVHQVLSAGFRGILAELAYSDDLANQAAREAAKIESLVREIGDMADAEEAPTGTRQAIDMAKAQIARLRRISLELIDGGQMVREQVIKADQALDVARGVDDQLTSAGAGGRIVRKVYGG